ncbi:receptor-type tyrosine-protein phosphatase S-like isoform X10 [Acropora millepora]|uniref:receptor-type tyrosine-protein phosphatase S-like isoform X10 n=1 Tax=Acropora millepora TaxID=45264 RepID=UPI001CF40697|nr:receptor-type tyrosine-protein phosphatase S-like isoform X10 [Acropora millepora]
MECVLLLVVLLDLACSVLTTQGKPGSTLQMEFPNSPEGHHPATMSSFFPAVSFSPSSRDNMVKTSQVESSTLILPSLSKADVKGKLPSVKSELGVMNSKTEDFVQRIETELTPKVTFSRSASLTQTSVSPTSEVTASTSSVLSQVSGVGASSGLFQMQVASSHLQNNNATATLSTVRVEGRSTLMLTQGLSAINEQNVVTASKIIQSTTTSLQFSASGRDSLSLESKGVSSFKAQSTLHTHQLLPQTASRSNVQSILSASLSIRRTVQLVTSVGVASSLTSEPAFSPDIRASPMQTDGILTKTVLTSHVKNMSTANATAYTTARTFQLATSQIITPSVISEGESMTGVSQSKIKTDQVSALTVLTSEVYKMSSSVLIAHNQESHFAGSQGSLASLASDVSSNVARMSTVQIDLGQSQAQISRSASSSVLHVVTLSSLLPVQSLTTWKPSFTQSKVANTSIPSRSVSVHKMSHSSSHMAQSGMVISPTNQSVHPILSASAPVSRFIHGMKAESSSSHLQDVSLIFNTSQVSTLPMTRRSVPKSTHTSSEKSLYSIGMSSASIKMPNSSESVSYKKIDPTTTYAPVSMTSWYPSSSVFLLPPTAVPGKPDAPVIQSAKVLSANGVYLKWNATNIQSFVNFSIDFSQDAVAWVQATCNNSLVQVACVVNQTEAVVLLLKPFTNYTFRVMAKSRFGNSNYSLESQWVLTGEAAPSGSPVITTAHNVSSTEIVVAWKPPPLQTLNGKLRSYEVQITELKGTPTSLPTEVTVSSSSSSFGSSAHVSYPTREPHMLTTAAAAVEGIQQVGVPVSLDAKLNLSIHIAELKKWSNYLVRVRAHTVAAGPFSDAVVVRTDEDAPTGPPRNVRALTISSSSISLFWMPPEPEAQNGPITGYSIFVKGDSESTKHFKVTAGMMAYNATGLRPYTNYTFQMQALNVMGVGPNSSTVMNTTFQAAPTGPPRNVRALTISSSSISVYWTPPEPEEQNGLITGYNLFVKGDGEPKKHFKVTAGIMAYNATGLRPYTNYTFQMQAFSVMGVGPYSSTVMNTTFQAAPTGFPRNVRALTISSSSISLFWMPPEPEEQNGPITGYNIFVKGDSEPTKLFKVAAGMMAYNATGLRPYTNYTFRMQALNIMGVGPNSSTFMNTTFQAAPTGPPRNVRALAISSSSISLFWMPPEPEEQNGPITGYNIFVKGDSESTKHFKVTAGMMAYNATGLRPYTNYTFQMQALNVMGVGPNSSTVMNTTFQAAPSHDIQLKVLKFDSRSIELSWTPPSRRNGKIGYFLSYWKFQGSFLPRQDLKSIRLPGKITSKVVRELKPYSEYKFEIVAYNLRKNSNASAPNIALANTTAEEPSGPPRNVRIINTTSDSITLSWDPPLEPNGKILGYKVKYFEKGKPDKDVNDHLKENVYIITALKPYRFYKIHVACRSSGGIGPASPYVEQQTKAGEPPPLGTLAPPDKRSIKSNSFIVRLTKASNEMGEVKYYQVIVRELATDNRNKPVPLEEPDSVKPKDLYTYDEARRRKPKLVPYIAAQFPAREFDLYENFVVGAGSKGSSEAKRRRRRRRVEGDSQEYYNGPLEENTYYAVFQRAYVSEDVYSSSDWTEPVTTAAIAENKDPPSSTPIGMIVGLILVIVIVALLILVVIYFVRRKRGRFDRVMDDRDDFTNGQPVKMKKLSRKRKSIQKKLMGSIESLNALEDLAASRAKRQPVPIDDFERHVSRMHMDGDHGFSEEYSLVQPDEEFSFQQFLNPANKYKNRYANIVAYDHTRVLLNPLEGVAGSDYINANFIDGYNRQRAYIAAQGPLMETFDDFWRMIWEQMSSVIVMLTKLEERGRRKCDQYWPERGTKSHGQIQVTLKETLNMSHYTLRKFIITHKQFPDDDRLIKQFHFTAWPDHGVPSHPTPLLSLVRHSYNANRQSVGPMVVHCSAGVGRTGTFITLDVMLQRISQEDSIDVFGFVRQMRYQRNFMVQTEAQYVFIHDAVLEAITCGVTEVEAKDLSFRIRELRQFDPETGYTYMENEFSRLAKEENHPIAFKSATLNCNAAKNRYANILPFESTRVHLKMRPGEMGSDYINANFIDGYCQPRAYIATQAPIPDTFEDFWRLIWEQESATVVMLTREEEAGKIKCHHYWPTEGSRLYGVILVELIEETSFGDYFSRKFKLTHTEEKDSHTVCQFHYTDWPDIGVPDSGVGIVDLIGQVQKWQQHSGNTSIVIHCSGGVGRTGVFCGISMMIERLKSEGVVDVFQTVQAMRLQRPAMVQTAEQYDFCYTTLQEYLDSFDLYANFQ